MIIFMIMPVFSFKKFNFPLFYRLDYVAARSMEPSLIFDLPTFSMKREIYLTLHPVISSGKGSISNKI